MIRLVSLFIWASLSIGGVASEGCFSNLVWPGLKSEPASGGWNGVGKCFLTLFTPERLTVEHWKIIGKMKKNFEAGDISDLAFTMGGLVFLLVVSILLILVFCAAPCALGAYWCTCKKKCKPKSNAIVIFGGIGCNSLAILTIFLSILFCFLAINSLTSGIESVGTAFDPLPSVMDSMATTMKEQAKCPLKSSLTELTKILESLPKTISMRVSKIKELDDVMKIDFAAKGAKIGEFDTDADNLLVDITKARAALEALGASDTTLLNFLRAGPLSKLAETTTNINDFKGQLSSSTIKDKLADVEKKRQAGSISSIEEKVKDKIKPAFDQITTLSADMNTKVDEGFKQIEKYKSKVKSIVDDKIKKNVETAKEYLGYAKILNLVLFPCYLALASAIWSTCQSIKFVQKKKAKPKEKSGLLIPITIGLTLAFIPLLVSSFFMMFSGVFNVACNSLFQDQSFGFVPQALNAFNLDPSIDVRGTKVDIEAAIKECQSGTALISVLKGDSLLDVNKVIKEFDIEAKKKDMADKLGVISLGLPAPAEITKIETDFAPILVEQAKAKGKITDLKGFVLPGGQSLMGEVKEVKTIVEALETFSAKVEAFDQECKDAFAAATALDETKLKNEMIDMMNKGAGTPENPGMLKMMETKLNAGYLEIRTEFLTKSTNCNFLFAAWADVGAIVCDQGVSGAFGVYSAIGLGVLAFFSACVGTVLIWHSLRAGKEGPQKKPTDEKSSDVNSKKKKKKDGEEGGDEYEVVETVEIVQVDVANQKAKIGDQADPMKAPSSQPTPPGQAPSSTPPVVQAVLTDPAAPGDKTNPSLLPNDEQLAPTSGAGAAPAGLPPVIVNMQMVNMEANKEDKDQSNNSAKQNNSITGAGGETKGDGPGGTQQ